MKNVILKSVISFAVSSSILFTSHIANSQQTILYVDQSIQSEMKDGSRQRPFNTIQAAINVSAPDSDIYVSSGTYNEWVVLNKPLRIHGFGTEKPRLVEGSNSAAVVYFYSSGSIDNFDISSNLPPSDPELPIGVKIKGNVLPQVQIENCLIHGVSVGIEAHAKGEILIQNNEITRNNIGIGVLYNEGSINLENNFYLYIDEFQNFVTPSMAAILSGARKYHLGLILAHQELRQLWNKETDIASAVISNPYTRICFRLGDFDAQKMKDGFSFFDAKDLQNLGTGEAICRIERAEFDSNLKTLPLPKIDPETAKRSLEAVAALSRQNYGRTRVEVEAELAQRRIIPVEPEIKVNVEKATPRRRERITQTHQEIPAQKSETAIREPIAEAPALGRGGAQHKYLQQLIKQLAENRGYRAIVEKPVLGGTGSVDISLERADHKIACEISINTSCEHEFGNVQKCIAASYDSVILLSPDRKTLGKIKEFAADKLQADQISKLLFLLPEEFVAHLDQLAAVDTTQEQNIKGYRVKVQHKNIGKEEKKTRKQAISQVILQAMKRLKRS